MKCSGGKQGGQNLFSSRTCVDQMDNRETILHGMVSCFFSSFFSSFLCFFVFFPLFPNTYPNGCVLFCCGCTGRPRPTVLFFKGGVGLKVTFGSEPEAEPSWVAWADLMGAECFGRENQMDMRASVFFPQANMAGFPVGVS